MLFGTPSVEIIAALANDRTIMWREVPGPWCGQAAADMYEDLAAVLRKRYPGSKSFRVVEDGDTKGFQSNAGKQAKTDQRICSWKLPPRSPEWMPLDYSLWEEIESRFWAAGRSLGTESLAQAKRRLKSIAQGLPRKYVRKTVRKMRDNILQTQAAKGKRIESD